MSKRSEALSRRAADAVSTVNDLRLLVRLTKGEHLVLHYSPECPGCVQVAAATNKTHFFDAVNEILKAHGYQP